MTAVHSEEARSSLPTGRESDAASLRHLPTQRHAPSQSVPEQGLAGRPRSVAGEEAYERSVREQAATDIAAGW